MFLIFQIFSKYSKKRPINSQEKAKLQLTKCKNIQTWKSVVKNHPKIPPKLQKYKKSFKSIFKNFQKIVIFLYFDPTVSTCRGIQKIMSTSGKRGRSSLMSRRCQGDSMGCFRFYLSLLGARQELGDLSFGLSPILPVF